MAKTFLQLSQAVQKDVRKESISAAETDCKHYVNLAYQAIWDMDTWTDTKSNWSQSVTSGTGDITLSAEIDRVQAVVWDGQELENIDHLKMFRVRPSWQTDTGTPAYYMVQPKNSSGTQVIRLDVLPTLTKTILVIGKKKFTALSSDSDILLLGNADNAVISMAAGMYFKSVRLFNSGNDRLAEAFGHIKIMKNLERNQQTNIVQLMPDAEDWAYNDFIPKAS